MGRERRRLTRKDVETHLAHARENRRRPDLVWAVLEGLDLSRLDFTSDVYEGIFNSALLGADFRNTNLSRCNFRRVDLACANLRGTDLSDSDLAGANLYSALLESAKLSSANLEESNLVSAELHGVTVDGASFAGARLGKTSVVGVDLSRAQGLAEVVHIGPTAFDSGTLLSTAAGMAELNDAERSDLFRFLSNAGVHDDFLAAFRSWVGKPIEFFSVFIGHSSLDKEFARQLYRDLRALGVNCWFDEKNILPGDSILEEIDRGVRLWEKLILVCSESSLSPKTGWWVEQEIERALSKERELRASGEEPALVLVPISLDDYVFDSWSSRYRATVLERNIGDFRRWREPREYATALERLRLAIDQTRGLTRRCS